MSAGSGIAKPTSTPALTSPGGARRRWRGLGRGRRPRRQRHAVEAGLKTRRKVSGEAWIDKSPAKRTEFTADYQVTITRHTWKKRSGPAGIGSSHWIARACRDLGALDLEDVTTVHEEDLQGMGAQDRQAGPGETGAFKGPTVSSRGAGVRLAALCGSAPTTSPVEGLAR
jgi:hypothetical protein